ncbi:MAG: AAA family ATPase [Acidobacteriota bacterium]
MILKNVVIKDFLSIRGTIKVVCDQQVTILLGANDHGKSNILSAIEHLNEEVVIGEDETNWDAAAAADQPRLEFVLELNEAERTQLPELVTTWLTMAEAQRSQELLEKKAKETAPEEKAKEEDKAAKAPEVEEDEEEEDDEDDRELKFWENVHTLRTILQSELPRLRIVREGVGTELAIGGVSPKSFPREILNWFVEHLPRVELLRALSGELQDSVTVDKIASDTHEFLQGVFFYAGLDPFDCKDLFRQTDTTERVIDKATKQLDEELRRLWMQGTDLGLHFELSHREGAIEFLVEDPSVQARKTRMSKRSTGVTQFFRISMVLHARRCKRPANSYIFLFDEPGVFLHPQGQKDLIQVFEQLSTESQVVYTTHSLFLLNQNFPERHRLILRDKTGTRVDQKPYRANWRLATDALGVYLTSNIIFSSKVLLVEGDSDPIHIYEMFRYLNRSGKLDADANSLGILSFSDLPNLRFLLQVFKRDGEASKVLVLVDGDKQGKKVLTGIKALCERLEVPTRDLQKDESIEDYVLSIPQFIDAVIETITLALQAEQIVVPAALEEEVRKSWKEHSEKPEKSAGKWFKELSKKFVGDEASKVALARIYAFACRDAVDLEVDEVRVAKALELCERIAKHLDIPRLKAEKVFEEPAPEAIV